MERRVTIVDVAREAGVAVGTASDALNDKGRVAEATRTRVKEAALTLSYLPDAGARALVTGRAMAVGVRIGDRSTIPEDGFFIDLLNGAAATAAEHGYSLVITPSELRHAARLDALIVVDPLTRDQLQDALDANVPVVTVGRVPRGQPRVPTVDIDHDRSIPLLMNHLAAGARPGPAWLISQTPRPSFVRDVESAFTAWGETNQRSTAIVAAVDDRTAVSRAVAARIAQEGPPAILIGVLASPTAWALGALTELGLAVPEEVQVGSASDGPILRLVAPAVTTLDVDGAAHGREAMRLALEGIGRRRLNVRPVLLPARLVPRASSGTAGGRPGVDRR